MGIPIKGASYVNYDNMSVIMNVCKPKSMLKKKWNAIYYHTVRETVELGKALVAHISTNKNPADLFKKVLYGQTWQFLVNRMLWDMFSNV